VLNKYSPTLLDMSNLFESSYPLLEKSLRTIKERLVEPFNRDDLIMHLPAILGISKGKLEKMINEFEPFEMSPAQVIRRRLRALVRARHDIQLNRIRNGSRIIASIHEKLGRKPGMRKDEIKGLGVLILKAIEKQWSSAVASGIVSNHRDITKFMNKQELGLITDAAEGAMARAYFILLAQEHRITEELKNFMNENTESLKIWPHLRDNCPGCGTALSGVLQSEIDIEKCDTISKLWKYAGLDVVTVFEDDGSEVWSEARCYKETHLIDREYVDKEGETKTKKSITFNPFLQSKILGVLSDVLMMRNKEYLGVYRGYRHRVDQEVEPRREKYRQYLIKQGVEEEKREKRVLKKFTPNHLNNMAKRYMVKRFLADLWPIWRRAYGLSVTDPYEVAKLNMVHHESQAHDGGIIMSEQDCIKAASSIMGADAME